MSDVKIKVDKRQFDRAMQEAPGQVKFALSKAVNDVTTQAQKAIREHNNKAFTIRRQSFADRAIKIKPFSTKQTLTATIQVDPPGGIARDVFSQHELGGEKKSIAGKRIAIPLDAIQPDDKKVIPKAKRPTNLKNAFKGQMLGKGSQLLFQRMGKGRNMKIRPAYLLVKSVTLKPKLNFEKTVNATVNRNFKPAFDKAFAAAMALAKTKR